MYHVLFFTITQLVYTIIDFARLGYVIKNYLYLINVKVSRSINFNFNRQSTDKLPTDHQWSTDMLLTVGRLSTDRLLKLWKKTVGQLFTVAVVDLLKVAIFNQWPGQT